MNWQRLGKLLAVGMSTFVAIALAAWLFITLIAPTTTPARMVVFIGAMFAVTGAVIAVVVWAVKEDSSMTVNEKTSFWLGLGSVVVVVIVAVCLEGRSHHGKEIGTVLVLGVTAIIVVFYARDTRNLAKSAKDQTDITRILACGAAPFVAEAIVTVERFLCEHKLDAVVPKCWVAERDEWLMIEVSNEGPRNALNVSVFWDGVPTGAEREQGWMPSIPVQDDWNPCNFLRVDKFPPEDQLPWEQGSASDKCVWRIWRLKPEYKALLYLRKPPDGGRKLVIEWFDIIVQTKRRLIVQEDKKRPGVWITSWIDQFLDIQAR